MDSYSTHQLAKCGTPYHIDIVSEVTCIYATRIVYIYSSLGRVVVGFVFLGHRQVKMFMRAILYILLIAINLI